MHRSIQLVILTGFLSQFAAHGALAQISQDDYEKALESASKHVARKRQVGQASVYRDTNGATGRLGTGRKTWKVVTIHEVSRTGISSHPLKRVNLFQYTLSSDGKLTVTQLGPRKVDDKVAALEYETDAAGTPTSKTYVFSGSGRTESASLKGTVMRATPLELYPLDPPALLTAVPDPARAAEPSVPAEIRDFIPALSDVKPGRWFEQTDFFARPIRFYWRDGEPWPAYLETPNGISILLREGT